MSVLKKFEQKFGVVWYIIIPLLVSLPCHSQNTFQGKVISDKGIALPYCNVFIKNNLTQGTITDYNGIFTINAHLKDTIVVKFIGFLDSETIVTTDFITIVLKPSITELPEFIVKYDESKLLSAKDVIKVATKKWARNHFNNNSSNVGFKLHSYANIECTENNNDIYTFNGNIDLYEYRNNLYGTRKDSVGRKEIKPFIIEVKNIKNYRPYSSVFYYLYKLPFNKNFEYEIGDMSFFMNEEVYQIKFHRKNGKKYCEAGGFYLIAKKSFALLYMEQSVIYCNPFIVDNPENNYQIQLNFSKDMITFDKQEDSIYFPIKIETQKKITYSNNKDKNREFYSTLSINTLSVKKMNISNETIKTLSNLNLVFMSD